MNFHHHHHTNSMSVIPQLLFTWFWQNFKGLFLRPFLTGHNCPVNICPGNICPFLNPFLSIILWQKLFDTNFMSANFFWTKLFQTQIFFGQQFFLHPNSFLIPKTFSDQKLFWIQNFSEPKFIFHPNYQPTILMAILGSYKTAMIQKHINGFWHLSNIISDETYIKLYCNCCV